MIIITLCIGCAVLSWLIYKQKQKALRREKKKVMIQRLDILLKSNPPKTSSENPKKDTAL